MSMPDDPPENARVPQRGVVVCHKCRAKIHVQRLTALTDEFSVRCPSCGQRDFYQRREIAIEDIPEQKKKTR